MRTIVIFGHQAAAQAVFSHVDAHLRRRAISDVAIMFTLTVDAPTAEAVRSTGSGDELWYCGPTAAVPREWGGDGADVAHRQLLAASWVELQARTAMAVREFLDLGATA